MEETLVLIDNAYLKLVSKEFNENKIVKYNLLSFSKKIAELFDLYPKKTYFFDAPPFVSQNSLEDKLRKSKFDKFIDFLRNSGIIIKLGRLQKIGNQFIQKGVDTQITMALLIEPFIEDTKNIIIITSDSDFVPAIDYIKSKQRKVFLFCYNDYKRNSKFSTANELRQVCDSVVQLKKEYLIY
ncbi:MAG: NYN domain-containing protein [archaeon]|jgi:uncharacterized LabA/DUF88 family protein